VTGRGTGITKRRRVGTRCMLQQLRTRVQVQDDPRGSCDWPAPNSRAAATGLQMTINIGHPNTAGGYGLRKGGRGKIHPMRRPLLPFWSRLWELCAQPPFAWEHRSVTRWLHVYGHSTRVH